MSDQSPLPVEFNHASDLTKDLWLVANRNDSHALARAANALFGPPHFETDEWGDHRMVNFLREGDSKELTAWWGPGGSKKTFDAAKLALTYWMAAPDRTTVTCCSTTAKMLDQRIWGSIKRLYSSIKGNPEFEGLPFKFYEGDARILKFEGEAANQNSMLRGVAIEQGSLDDAIGNIIGVHNERMLLIVDECQASREALIEARVNLRKGTTDFRILLLGNPTGRLDPLGRYSEPNHPKGYDSIPIGRRAFPMSDGTITMVPCPEKAEWESRERQNGARGRVFCYFGFDAPSLKSDAEAARLHFMIQREDIEKDIREYGPDHPRLWTFTIGFIPPFTTSGALFSDQTFSVRNPHEEPRWRGMPIKGMSVDPAFVRGGDGFICTPFACGIDVDGKLRLHFYPHRALQIGSPPPGMLIEEHACLMLAQFAQVAGISAEGVVFDASMNQRLYVALLERAMKQLGVMAFDGRTAPGKIILAKDEKIANEVVGNARAEAWLLVWHFLERAQLSGISDEAVSQFCAVQIKAHAAGGTGTGAKARMYLEDKAELKKRLKKSPDEADTVAMACYFVRHRLGCTPGLHEAPRDLLAADQNLVDDLGVSELPMQLPTYGVKRR